MTEEACEDDDGYFEDDHDDGSRALIDLAADALEYDFNDEHGDKSNESCDGNYN